MAQENIKKSGWAMFVNPLVIANIACILISISIFYAFRDQVYSSGIGPLGPAIVLTLFVIFIVIPVCIISIICTLLYLAKKRMENSVKTIVYFIILIVDAAVLLLYLLPQVIFPVIGMYI